MFLPFQACDISVGGSRDVSSVSTSPSRKFHVSPHFLLLTPPFFHPNFWVDFLSLSRECRQTAATTTSERENTHKLSQFSLCHVKYILGPKNFCVHNLNVCNVSSTLNYGSWIELAYIQLRKFTMSMQACHATIARCRAPRRSSTIHYSSSRNRPSTAIARTVCVCGMFEQMVNKKVDSESIDSDVRELDDSSRSVKVANIKISHLISKNPQPDVKSSSSFIWKNQKRNSKNVPRHLLRLSLSLSPLNSISRHFFHSTRREGEQCDGHNDTMNIDNASSEDGRDDDDENWRKFNYQRTLTLLLPRPTHSSLSSVHRKIHNTYSAPPPLQRLEISHLSRRSSYRLIIIDYFHPPVHLLSASFHPLLPPITQ